MLPDLADFYVSFRSGFSGEESRMLVWAGRDRDSSGLRPLGMTITFAPLGLETRNRELF